MTRDLVGGHPALDLVNTVWWRGDPTRRVDRVPDLPAFLVWAARAGLGPIDVVPDAAEPAAGVIATVHALREHAHAVLAAHATGAPVPPAPLRELHAAGAEAMRRSAPRLALPLRWESRAASADEVPDVVAGSLVDLLAHQDLTHLRVCADDDCAWLYLDRSRNHSRRWCSSAECGNRHRVQRFAARRSTRSSSAS
jgi:predicted RNA-binding Zn ribbon-like protein